MHFWASTLTTVAAYGATAFGDGAATRPDCADQSRGQCFSCLETHAEQFLREK
jgi:hypothetical protein